MDERTGDPEPGHRGRRSSHGENPDAQADEPAEQQVILHLLYQLPLGLTWVLTHIADQKIGRLDELAPMNVDRSHAGRILFWKPLNNRIT